MSHYVPVIGLEIHAQLLTKTKIFCSCEVDFGGDQNTRCCPVCTGFPGTLPVLNKQVVKLAIKAALALNCGVGQSIKIDRKNYFYPDLPKAYQISQLDLPIVRQGKIKIETSKGEKYVRINHAHIEEDAGKLIHEIIDNTSLADYNRCGVPLLEIVSEPDMSSAEEAKAYIEKIASLLQYADVSLCKMEEGSLRADVNVSLRPSNSETLGTKVEIKNLNSLKAIVRAIDYEIERQTKCLELGEKVIQETRKFNDNRGITQPMRSKEDVHDYRYFKEPDIIPIIISKEEIEEIQKELPLLIDARLDTYLNEHGLGKVEAKILVADRSLSDFYNEVIYIYPNYKSVSNFIIVELLKYENEGKFKMDDIPFTADEFAKLVQMTEEELVNRNNAKAILKLMIEEKKSPEMIAKEKEFLTNHDEEKIYEVVSDVAKAFKEEVEGYLAGKEKLFGFLMGQCTKKLAGRANPKVIKGILEQELNKLK